MPISVWMILNCLMVLVGLFILGRYRNRSRKATGIGIIALCGYGVLALTPIVPWQFAIALLGLGSVSNTVFSVAYTIGWTLCQFLLVVAIVIDRR